MGLRGRCARNCALLGESGALYELSKISAVERMEMEARELSWAVFWFSLLGVFSRECALARDFARAERDLVRLQLSLHYSKGVRL